MKKKLDIPARPTVYKGIKMRSRLEADFAATLDREGETWDYEPTCFGGTGGQWLPDFRVGRNGTYVELKSSHLILWDTPTLGGVYERIDEFLKRMTVAWESEPDAALQLVFWTYGLPDLTQAPLSIMGTRDTPRWFTYTPSTLDVPMLWPGMGQGEALGEMAGEGQKWQQAT